MPANTAALIAALVTRIENLEQRLLAPTAAVLDSLHTADAVAARLSVTERTLAEWRVSPPGTGPAFLRIGRGVCYRPEAVDAWLLMQEHSSTHEGARR